MNDGVALLKTVMQTRVKDENAVRALVDYLQEHIPPSGVSFEVRYRFRVRIGAVRLGVPPMLHPEGLNHRLLRVETFHNRGQRGCRSITRVVALTEPDMAAKIAESLQALRS